MYEPEPVDDLRLAKIHLAARAVVEKPDRHTPLELRWAKEVVDLATALRGARDAIGAGD